MTEKSGKENYRKSRSLLYMHLHTNLSSLRHQLGWPNIGRAKELDKAIFTTLNILWKARIRKMNDF